MKRAIKYTADILLLGWMLMAACAFVESVRGGQIMFDVDEAEFRASNANPCYRYEQRNRRLA